LEEGELKLKEETIEVINKSKNNNEYTQYI
jgi:hypothetical protein